jgi:folate-dependent tRNA-U54 methylase TrmFO/GidA
MRRPDYEASEYFTSCRDFRYAMLKANQTMGFTAYHPSGLVDTGDCIVQTEVQND